MVSHEDPTASGRRLFGRPLLFGLAGFLVLLTEQVTRAPVALQATTAGIVAFGLLALVVVNATRTPRDDARRFWLFVIAAIYGVPLTIGLAILLFRPTPHPTRPSPAPARPATSGDTP